MNISLFPFAIAAVVATVAAQLWRILAFTAGGADESSAIALSPVESAFLTGGAASAIAVLNAAPLSPGLDQGGRRTHPESAHLEQANQEVSDLLRAMEQSLVARGLLLSPRQRVTLHLAAGPLFLVAGLGLLQSLLNASYHDETVLLAGSSIFLLLLAVGLIATVPRRSQLGMTVT